MKKIKKSPINFISSNGEDTQSFKGKNKRCLRKVTFLKTWTFLMQL